MVSSFAFGPLLAIGMLSWRPSLTEQAHWLAQRAGTGEGSLLAMLLHARAAYVAGGGACVVGIGGVHALYGRHAREGPFDLAGRAAYQGI